MEESKKKEDPNFKYKAAAFLTGVTSLSLVGGFAMTLGWVKKQEPTLFNKSVTPVPGQATMESGGSLAMRALGRATLYSVSGFAIFCYGVWKLMGVHTMAEFREKMGRTLPAVPRNEPPQSRTEFSGIRDLLQYLVDEDNRKAAAAVPAPSQDT
ncbi:Transmembrane protein 242 [Trinorchestia longiramus]|nr:Transmembrane protein 242 [Trinorchestia longiramus]